MNNDMFYSPTRIVIGKGVLADTAKWVKAEGGSRVLVHHDSGYVHSSGLVDRVTGQLHAEGIETVELGGVVPNPHLDLVLQGIDLCRKERIDFILAVGGGSVIDSCKAIAAGVPYAGNVWDFFIERNGTGPVVPQKCLALGVVLTIAATGSEGSNGCVITKQDENLKRSFDNDLIRPRFAIEDPELTYSLPPYQTACGIVDIFSHSLERYFTCEKEGNQLTSNLCEAIFHTCLECGRILARKPDDYEARANIMLASTLSHNGLTGIGRTGDWASHMIEHELSGEFNIAHGGGLAILLPVWMEYVWMENPKLFLRFATRVMGVTDDMDHPDQTILEGIRRLKSFFAFLGLPTRLSDVASIGNVTEETINKMAKRVRFAHKDKTVGWVKRLTIEDVATILTLAC